MLKFGVSPSRKVDQRAAMIMSLEEQFCATCVNEQGSTAVVSAGCAVFSFSCQYKEMLGACGACQQKCSISYVHVIEVQFCVQ